MKRRSSGWPPILTTNRGLPRQRHRDDQQRRCAVDHHSNGDRQHRDRGGANLRNLHRHPHRIGSAPVRGERVLHDERDGRQRLRLLPLLECSSFPAGATVAAVTLTAINDSVIEGDETATLTLAADSDSGRPPPQHRHRDDQQRRQPVYHHRDGARQHGDRDSGPPPQPSRPPAPRPLRPCQP